MSGGSKIEEKKKSLEQLSPRQEGKGEGWKISSGEDFDNECRKKEDEGIIFWIISNLKD